MHVSDSSIAHLHACIVIFYLLECQLLAHQLRKFITKGLYLAATMEDKHFLDEIWAIKRFGTWNVDSQLALQNLLEVLHAFGQGLSLGKMAQRFEQKPCDLDEENGVLS